MVKLPGRGPQSSPTDGPLDEPPEVNERNLWLGARVIAGTTIMFFAAFVFAYFYLRSLNNSHLWRPAGVDPPQRYGTRDRPPLRDQRRPAGLRVLGGA